MVQLCWGEYILQMGLEMKSSLPLLVCSLCFELEVENVSPQLSAPVANVRCLLHASLP